MSIKSPLVYIFLLGIIQSSLQVIAQKKPMKSITITPSDRLTLDFEDYFDFSDVKDKSTLAYSAEISGDGQEKKKLGTIYDGPT